MILGLGNVTPPPPPCSQRKGEIEKQLGESKEIKERVILKKKIRTWETNFSAIIIVLGQGLFGGLREIREIIYRGLCHVSERMTFFSPSACKLVCYHSLMWHCYVTSFYSFFFHNLISLCLSVVCGVPADGYGFLKRTCHGGSTEHQHHGAGHRVPPYTPSSTSWWSSKSKLYTQKHTHSTLVLYNVWERLG